MRLISAVLAAKRASWLQVLKTYIAISLAWLVSVLLLGVALPVFAAIAALLIVAPSLNQTAAKGIERTLGVVGGVIIGSLCAQVFGQTSLACIVAIGVSMLCGWLARTSLGLLNQMAISSMLVIMLGGNDMQYASERIIETMIGAATGFIVNLAIVAPDQIEPARKRMADLGRETAACLQKLGDAMILQQTKEQLEQLLVEARLLRPLEDRARRGIAAARESLMLNPRGRSKRMYLNGMEQLLEAKFRHIVAETIGMTRAFYDHYDDELCVEPMSQDIAEQLFRCAHDVRLLVHLAEVDPRPLTSSVPALTKPLMLATPRGNRWILIGSMMEDLRRIRTSLLIETANQ